MWTPAVCRLPGLAASYSQYQPYLGEGLCVRLSTCPATKVARDTLLTYPTDNIIIAVKSTVA